MVKRLEKHKADLYILGNADSETKRTLLDKTPDSLVLAVCDCARQLLNGEVHVSNNERKQLRRHKGILREIAHKKEPVASKRARLQQGKALPALSGLLKTIRKPRSPLKAPGSGGKKKTAGKLTKFVDSFYSEVLKRKR